MANPIFYPLARAICNAVFNEGFDAAEITIRPKDSAPLTAGTRTKLPPSVNWACQLHSHPFSIIRNGPIFFKCSEIIVSHEFGFYPLS